MTKILLYLGITIVSALGWSLAEQLLNGRLLTWREWLPAFAFGGIGVGVFNAMFR